MGGHLCSEREPMTSESSAQHSPRFAVSETCVVPRCDRSGRWPRSQAGKVGPRAGRAWAWSQGTWFPVCQLGPLFPPCLGLGVSSAKGGLSASGITGNARFEEADRKWSCRNCPAFEALPGREVTASSRKMGTKQGTQRSRAHSPCTCPACTQK